MATPFILSAAYEGSFATFESLKASAFSEFAFAGRSNVGKSSLINYLANKKEMARTSSQPGKTQTFNYYTINNKFYWVDMPGYGFAKVSVTLRNKWKKEMETYLGNREQLVTLFQLVDSRIKPQANDLEFSRACIEGQVPLAIVFTKADKKFKNEVRKNISDYQDELLKFVKMVPTIFITSASDQTGKEEIVDWMKMLLEKN
jgi:GTP-binding protein